MENLWRLSPSQLRTLRGGAVGRSRAQIVSIHSSRPSASLEAVKAVEEALLTADEDGLLVQFYVDKCMEVCKFLQLPDRVLATAVTYAKRFYLTYSSMDYHPKHIILTAIFLACKTEENYLDLVDFLKRTNQKQALGPLLMSLEVVLMQALRFDLIVPHPYDALYGLYLQMRASRLFTSQDANEDLVSLLYKNARSLVDRSFTSDALFVFQPSQVALAALDAVSKQRRCQQMFFAFLQSRYGSKPDELAFLARTIEQVQQLLQATIKVDKETATAIDKKLLVCRNPAYDPESDYYKEMQAKEDKKFLDD